MRALVLERKGELAIRDIGINETMGATDVRIAVHTVGVCGSDVHYYQHGGIGDFIVTRPMVLGHEASGTVLEVGADVRGLRPGDRVCMEPGVTRAPTWVSRVGHYNLEPGVEFWATPPVHGVLRPQVVHPAELTFRLPDQVSYAEGAMAEPLAVGVHAVNKARVALGDVVVVHGAGTIGLLTTLAARAAGSSHVIVTDVKQAKLDVLARYPFITPVNARGGDVAARVMDLTAGRGADVVFEASGSTAAAESCLDLVRPAGTVVFIGMPQGPIAYDLVKAQTKEAHVEHVFRYASVFDRTIALLASGQIDVKPLISRTFPFAEAVEAFELAASGADDVVKVQIELGGAQGTAGQHAEVGA